MRKLTAYNAHDAIKKHFGSYYGHVRLLHKSLISRLDHYTTGTAYTSTLQYELIHLRGLQIFEKNPNTPTLFVGSS